MKAVAGSPEQDQEWVRPRSAAQVASSKRGQWPASAVRLRKANEQFAFAAQPAPGKVAAASLTVERATRPGGDDRRDRDSRARSCRQTALAFPDIEPLRLER